MSANYELVRVPHNSTTMRPVEESGEADVSEDDVTEIAERAMALA